MKFSLPKTILLNAFQKVIPAVENKSTFPFLKGIFMSIQNNTLTLIGSNLDFTIQNQVNLLDFQKEGYEFSEGTALPLLRIVDILKKMPEEKINFEVNMDNYHCTLKSGNSQFIINGFNPEEFRKINNNKETKTCFSISSALLCKNLKMLLFAVGRDVDRPAFTGVNFIFEDGKLTMQSSDTFRLAQEQINIDYNGNKAQFLIMGRYLTEIQKILERKEENVKISLEEKSVFFQTENVIIEVRLMQDKYTSFDSIFPESSTTNITVVRKDFLDALERALLLSEGINHSAEFRINPDSMFMYSHSDVGETSEQIYADISGESLKVVLNCRFLIEVLKVLESDNVIISFNNSFGPCLVTTPEEQGYIYLTLPLKTN